MKYGMRTWFTKLIPIFCLALWILWPGMTLAQVSNEARREAARLERLAGNVWEGLLEEHRYGTPVDSTTKLEVFNFYNGAQAFRTSMERTRSRSGSLADLMELLQIQSQAVDRSLGSANIGTLLEREWEYAKISLASLARLLKLKETPPPPPPSETTGERENVNELSISVTQVNPTGNFLKSEYRIRGVISGRNLVSAGIYAKGQLLSSLSVPLHSTKMSETPFSFRMKSQDGITIRVIDNQGLLVEEAVEFPAGGILPSLR